MTSRTQKTLGERITNSLTGSTAAPLVDPEMIREIAKLLEETGLSEIEIERSGTRIRVARGVTVTTATSPTAASAQPTLMPPEKRTEALAKRGTLVTSPMVGTVYLSPQPGTPPFVKVGDKVTDGTVCIVEAMKTMNPVAATVAGQIAEIFVRDGQPVEFGEPLMRIE
jgi:acetyl-CoA carboxylase biotin carboxyl carrier protein